MAQFDDKHAQIHFSFLCMRNKIVTTARNQKWKTDTLAAKFGHRFNAIHSEANVIKQFDWNYRELKHFTLVNVRLNRAGEVMLSKPCTACQKMLDAFNIGRVFYSVTEQQFLEF